MVFVQHGGIFAMVLPNRLRRTHEISGSSSSSIDKAGKIEGYNSTDKRKTEESPVSEIVPASEESLETADREIETDAD